MNIQKILLPAFTIAAILVLGWGFYVKQDKGGDIAALGDGLVVFDWSGYEDEGFFQNYVTQHGGSPTFAFFGEEEEAFKNCVPALRQMCPTPVANPYLNGTKLGCSSHSILHG